MEKRKIIEIYAIENGDCTTFEFEKIVDNEESNYMMAHLHNMINNILAPGDSLEVEYE